MLRVDIDDNGMAIECRGDTVDLATDLLKMISTIAVKMSKKQRRILKAILCDDETGINALLKLIDEPVDEMMKRLNDESAKRISEKIAKILESE